MAINFRPRLIRTFSFCAAALLSNIWKAWVLRSRCSVSQPRLFLACVAEGRVMAVGCQGRGSDMERNQPEPGVWHWGNGNCSWLPVCKAMGRSLAAVWGGNEHPLRGHSPPGITLRSLYGAEWGHLGSLVALLQRHHCHLQGLSWGTPEGWPKERGAEQRAVCGALKMHGPSTACRMADPANGDANRG